jgi:hypothetical protein
LVKNEILNRWEFNSRVTWIKQDLPRFVMFSIQI